jgi:uncharacterized protein (DUF1697 family)
MAAYGAFLRGMNLGAHRRITNRDLAAAFTALGFAEVSPYRASGNVAFQTRATDERALARRIERGLEASLGYAVPTFVRTAAHMTQIAARAPFPAAAVDASTGKLQVALLPREPAQTVAREARSLASAEDMLAMDGSELYWLPSGRMIESELDLKRLEALVGPWTMRTKATIEGMASKLS